MTRDTARRPGVLGDMFSRLFRDGQVDAITSGASAAAQVAQRVARQLRHDLRARLPVAQSGSRLRFVDRPAAASAATRAPGGDHGGHRRGTGRDEPQDGRDADTDVVVAGCKRR
jgi:hypothetical protein